ncbi:SLAM family member 6 [Crotalus tigris]|uniref:SLAM family member 6 n=1 Tax=Crotalus tigris TaxID=88082 RepID=UPI00192F6626|nr:SLAM family member 6 [Crotalus tigris]
MSSGILLLGFLLLSSAGAASSPEPTLKSVRVGNAVTLPVAIPKGQSVTNLLLRAAWREEGVAIWMDSKEISVISTHYAGRVAFLEDEMAFRIANLSLGDGDTYEISTSFAAPSPQLLSSSLVAVFNVTERISLENNSCHIDLDCEAGMGPGHKVTYTWKDTKAGTTLSQEARLSQRVQINQEKAYTCTAQTTTAQSTFSIVLQHPCTPNTASPGPWALGLASLLLRGLLVPAMTAALLL